jgi:uncharacterized protein
MTATILGLIIGLVMGLTGAGGALIAIPLFIEFLGMSLKDASVYSLIAVVIASAINLIDQRKSAHLKLGFSIFSFSILGSLASSPLKAKTPEILVIFLLIMISLYALYGIWFDRPAQTSHPRSAGLKLTALIGVILGALTTLTGLGGGVLMVPVFLKVYQLPQREAVATSLLAVGLTAMVSFIIQFVQGTTTLILDTQALWLGLGILLSGGGMKVLLKMMPPHLLVTTRRLVFTLVVMIAIAKLIIR